MLDRARLTAATPRQRIACVRFAKSWNSWSDIFPVRIPPLTMTDLSSVAVRGAREKSIPGKARQSACWPVIEVPRENQSRITPP